MVDFCNNEEWLAAYIDRRLSAEENRLYELHIARCRRCLANLVTAKRELDEEAASVGGAAGSAAAGTSGGGASIDSPAQGFGAAAPRRRVLLSGLAEHLRLSGSTYAAIAAAMALVFVLSRLLLSPAWDPELTAVRAQVERVVSAARLGDLQLAGGTHQAPGPSAIIRGVRIRDPATLARIEGSLHALLRRYPSEPDLYTLLGHLHLVGDNFDRAEAAYRRAALLAPGDGGALNNLAVISYRRGDADAALTRLADAAMKERVPPEAYYNLGILHRETGHRAESRTYLVKYINCARPSFWTERAESLLAN